ncbi:hypothetical protein POM88_032999 [Heracleum sosnowskyi]|uniref:DUF6598 domain-containing protein n=1 Tax=Heracleum sosnowskyi TaxID=360622 RepID=A0AAD8I0R7_9APIA|nr:hypothetical protein POM88_032999 [Heracleum sosnowskyi]
MADNQFESYEADSEASKSVVHKGRDGISILEVYSVTYRGSYPMEAKDQIGSISMKTNNIDYDLYYERTVDTSKPPITYGDQLPMWNVGPICSFTDLELTFDGFSDNYEDSKVFSHSPKDGDLLAELSMKSLDGYMRKFSVLFGCFSNATVANIKVMVLPRSTSSDATTNVYGVVVASNSKFVHNPSCRSYLFSRNPASTIQVGYNDVIPLSKSRVGVPLDSKLNVDISLFCDGPHKGTAEFIPYINGKYSKKNIGDQIQVEVTWNCKEDSDSTDEDSDDFTDEDSSSADEFDSASEY